MDTNEIRELMSRVAVGVDPNENWRAARVWRGFSLFIRGFSTRADLCDARSKEVNEKQIRHHLIGCGAFGIADRPGANRRWRWPFRCRGSRRESAVAQLSTLGRNHTQDSVLETIL
jgi:hypothetical protein